MSVSTTNEETIAIVDGHVCVTLEQFITWQTEEDEHQRRRTERLHIAQRQQWLDSSMLPRDQALFGIIVEPDSIYFPYRGSEYVLTYMPERENWQVGVRRGKDEHPFYHAVPKRELWVQLLRMLAAERKRDVNAR